MKQWREIQHRIHLSYTYTHTHALSRSLSLTRTMYVCTHYIHIFHWSNLCYIWIQHKECTKAIHNQFWVNILYNSANGFRYAHMRRLQHIHNGSSPYKNIYNMRLWMRMCVYVFGIYFVGIWLLVRPFTYSVSAKSFPPIWGSCHKHTIYSIYNTHIIEVPLTIWIKNCPSLARYLIVWLDVENDFAVEHAFPHIHPNHFTI